MQKILNKLLSKIGNIDFSVNKLGGNRKIVQIDETMLNYKCKSHRGRSPDNKTDALCIVEFDMQITRCFATVINDRKVETILPIILRQVHHDSIIHNKEFKFYNSLFNHFYYHGTVCHKYCFVNKITGVHTQAVESFKNELKREIKNRNGVETRLR